MKRLHIILSGLFLTMMPSVMAEAPESFVLGSCGHAIASSGGMGSDRAGEIAAAMYVPASRLQTLAGNTISRIDAGLISRINVREMKVWVRESLEGNDLASGYVERGVLGWNEIPLSEPYVIKSGCPGLYIGFEYANTGSSHPVSFVGEAGDYEYWFSTSESGKWENMTSRGALSIEAVVTGENLPLYDLTLLSGNIHPDFSLSDTGYVASGTVTNKAMRPVTGFRIGVEYEGVLVGEAEVSLDVEPGAKASFSIPFVSSAILRDKAMLIIESLTDGQDANEADNSVEVPVAFLRNVLLEEFTTEACPNCPEGARMIHDVLDSDPVLASRTVAVCHHAGFGVDWLTRPCDTDLLWMYDLDGQTFAPAAMFDRQPLFRRGLQMNREEPIVALRSDDDVRECLAVALAVPSHAMLGMKVGDPYSSAGEQLVDVEVRILTDEGFALSNPHLTFYTLENDVKAIHQEGASGVFFHQHVIRTDNGAWGEPVEIADGEYSRTFSVALKSEWNPDNLYFAAFLAERDEEDVKHNAVENVAMLPLKNDKEVTVYSPESLSAEEIARYDLFGNRLSRAAEGLNIVIYSDGTVKKIFNKANLK